jgi:hypothetical protein
MKRVAIFATGLDTRVLAMVWAPRMWAQDAVKQSPQFYTVRLENDRVRVLEYRLKPGEKEPTLSHPPGVVFYLSDATLRITGADGTVSESKMTNGQVS